MVVGLATLLCKVRFSLAGGEPPQPFQRITLWPRGGLVLRAERRN